MTTRIYLDPEGTPTGLETLIGKAVSEAGSRHGLLLLSCDANGFSPEKINAILQQAPLPIFGGTFPVIIHGKQILTRGTIGVTLPVASRSFLIPGFSTENINFADYIASIFTGSAAGQTMVVFVDGLARRIGDFIEGLFNVFGLDLNYVGGGAGSILMCPKPCLFSNQGMHEDGAVITLLPCDSGVGVCHGWEELMGPFQVTESHDNVIETLDWRPALEVYSEALATQHQTIISANDFYQTACAFPFGLSRLGTEQIVRDSLRIGVNNSLVCAGEVPEGSFVHILHSDAASLVDAAGLALKHAHCARPSWRKTDLHLFMDCVSRMLFLGDRFHEELEKVCPEGVPFVGACTIGEIANCRTEYLEFYNKTAVVAVLDSA